MAKLLGVEFAPLRVPLTRRLQTIAVLQWTLSFLFLGFGCLFLSVYLLFTRYAWVPLLYLLWYLYDRHTPMRGGRRLAWVRNWTVWKYFRDYYPIKLVKTAELDPGRNYIFGYHPHGIMSTGAWCNFATEATDFSRVFPGIRPSLLILRGQFDFPFYRDYIMTAGLCAVGKDSVTHLLTEGGQGNAVVLVIGGAVEALEARPGSYAVNLTTRKGFVKIALRHGVPLVPVFSFGENDVFTQIPNPKGSFVRNVQEFMTSKLGFSVPLFQGRGVFNYSIGLLPFRRPINTVVGAPIDVEKVEFPTQNQIDSLHAKYVAALQKLFDDHKRKYGVPEEQKLTFM